MRKLPLAIWAMVVGAFAMGADEFIVAGVVREIAQALNVTIGAVGALESVYALGVAIGAPVFTALGTRFGRRPMLLITTGVFLLGNLISALGPTYATIMAGRVVSAMAHGAFLGIAAVYAAELVDPARKGRAVAIVFSGLTASTILGAPIGAAVGQALGWRFTFWTLVVFGGIALLGLLASLGRTAAPHASHEHHHDPQPGAEYADLDAHALAHLGGAGQGPSMRDQLAALRRPAVWGALLTTMLGYGGVFTSYVYLAPQITEVTGFASGWVTPLLLIFGIGLFIGNHLGGKLADRAVMPTVIGSLSTLAIALFAMTFAIESKPATVVMTLVFGIAAFAVVAPLQLRVMSAAGHAPDVASAANISAFTLGSAIGIYLGGAAIDGGLGLSSVNWVGGLLTAAGLVTSLATWALLDRHPRTEPHDHAPASAHHH
ncbi:MFS transporter [Nonomuraea sp. NPDC049504]|uniref:MFS transporter n=1 Tax=Nonomuraea sp. NPDC049504 TaxID=3154729 RepID=UPI0034348503